MIFSRRGLIKILKGINDRLAKKALTGEMILYNNTALCMTRKINTMPLIEATYTPRVEIERMFAEDTRKRLFDSQIEQYVSENEALMLYCELSHLKVYVVEPKYLLAMKIRLDRESEFETIGMLIQQLDIKSINQLEFIVGQFYEMNKINDGVLDAVEKMFL